MNQKPCASWSLKSALFLGLMICLAGHATCADPPPSSPKRKPNVVLIVADDLAACLGCYGHPVCKTPNLDRLAKEGVRFERAYCQFPACGPSRASFMSGLHPAATRMLGNRKAAGAYKATNPALADHPSLGGLLRNAGCYSARVSKIYHMGVPRALESGASEGDEAGSWDWTCNVLAPETLSAAKREVLSPARDGWGTNFATFEIPDGREGTQADLLAAQAAVAFLENRAGVQPQSSTGAESRPQPGAPFFLAVGFVRPHVPFVAPARCFRQYPWQEMKLPVVVDGDLDDVPQPAAAMQNRGRYDMSEDAKRKTLAGYYASVTFMDEQVGKILAALDRLELRKETVVVFTSDHGYNLGEHDCWQKLSLFEESVRVPLIVSAPGFESSAGRSAKGIVELVDLYPTIAELAGASAEAPSIIQGKSFVPALEDPSREGKACAYTVSHEGGESVRTARWRYNRWGARGEELYDHDADPQEVVNVAMKKEYVEPLREMRATLEAARRRARLEQVD